MSIEINDKKIKKYCDTRYRVANLKEFSMATPKKCGQHNK